MNLFSRTPSPEKRYIPVGEELSARQLSLATWYARHRAQLARLGMWLLIVWCVATVGYSLAMWLLYAIVDYPADEVMYRNQVLEFQDYESINTHFAAVPLEVQTAQIFESRTGVYDFVTQVRNPNKAWLVRVTFRYEFVGGHTDESTLVLTPGQLQILGSLGVTSPTYPASVRLVVTKREWRRISPHAVHNPEAYRDERLAYTISDVQFARAGSDGNPTDQLRFVLTNTSAYSFWQAPFYVVSFDGGTMLGVQPILLDRWKTGEARVVDLRLARPTTAVSTVDVVPLFTVFDPTIFMPPNER